MATPSLRNVAALLFLFALCACAGRPARGVSDAAPQALSAAEYALKMVGKPYRYGGFTAAGFDCSGLVHYSYARAGLDLPRNTPALRRTGTELQFDELIRGDLVFFDQEGRKSSHVGIYLGDGRFVHAPSSGGKVRIDRLDSPYWSRHLNEARRVL
jgi:murein DD-endopeptidase